MTLDEAIEHANQVADSYKDTAPACKCAREHRQLAEWLHELKMLREAYGERQKEHLQLIIECSDAYDEIDNLKAENAKLHEGINAAWRNKSCKPGECLNCPYTCSWRTIGNLISGLEYDCSI